MQYAKDIPTTGRSSLFQCKQMGFSSVEDFANSLPAKATVVDVGAGVSGLGSDVVAIREDVTWINVDPFYKKMSNPGAANPQRCSEDITYPGKTLWQLKGKVDLVYSYWLLPHLSLEDNNHANSALDNMANLLNKGGSLVVGPKRTSGIGLLSPWRYKGTLKYAKSELSNDTIKDVIEMTKLWWLPRKIQLSSNKHNIHLLKMFVGGKS